MKTYSIIDAHCHIYPDKIAQKATDNTDRFYDSQSVYNGTLESLFCAGEQAGVSRFIVQSVATTPQQVASINRFISESVQQHPDKLTGLGTLHPASSDIKGDIDDLIELGLKGVKLHPDIQQFALDDPRCLAIYSYCQEKGLPLLTHAGDYRYDYSNPDRLKNVLRSFPDLTVIGAHFAGWSVWQEAMEKLAGIPNLYVDSSSTFGFMQDDVLAKELVNGFGADRILFGSDYPMWSAAEEIKILHKMHLSDTEYEKIFHLNAEKLFRI